MADLNHPLEPVVAVHRSVWSAIWAGVFTFLTIWFVFGALFLAIFARSADFDVAISIWGIVLTIIAMFIAGRATGQLAGVTRSIDGAGLGMVMFGLAVVASMFVLVVGANVIAGGAQTAGTAHASAVVEIFSDFGWAFFIALFLGWIAAMAGASSAHKQLAQPSMQHQAELHHA
jgi:hypothetical protein